MSGMQPGAWAKSFNAHMAIWLLAALQTEDDTDATTMLSKKYPIQF
jgi:hypothetical protein